MIKRNELNRSYGWRNVSEHGLPDDDLLCVAYTPGVEFPDGGTVGRIALGYYRKREARWVYSGNSWLEYGGGFLFSPSYWKPFSEISPYDSRLKAEISKLERELSEQEITLQKYREKCQKMDGKTSWDELKLDFPEWASAIDERFEKKKEARWTIPFGFYAYKNFAVDALREKIAKQDKTLREYEKKMSEMGERLRKGRSVHELCQRWVDRINSLPDPPKERRICAECEHVMINTQGDLSRCGLRRHPIFGHFVLCDIERGFKSAEYAFVCGPEGLYWAPKEEPLTSCSVGAGGSGGSNNGTSWATKNGGAG